MWVPMLLATTVLLTCLWETAGAEGPAPEEKIRFNRDIRPLLSDKCSACHGPDKNQRKADLRLDRKESAFLERKGRVPIVPGDLQRSELYRRITSSDPDERMPPPESKKSLSEDQVERIRRWILGGAEWEGHWAYLKPVRPELPSLADPSWCRNPIDRFILKRIEEAGLRLSPEADPITLIRRLSFDLLGLPPEPDEVAAFEGDADPGAYQRQVERLLASPHYGERMAMYWLDLVRYADTTGIHGDNHRNITPYRDYVIRAFNENKPFDRFTEEQLAGDLLPGSSQEQKVASGYNRLLMTTNEGGAQPGEYIAKYAADRVRNASEVWMGATLGCAECHDHKFDPYVQKDFYRFASFFADQKEPVPSEPGPPFPVPTPSQAAELAELDSAIAEVQKVLETPTPELTLAQAEWEAQSGKRIAGHPRLDPWHSIGPFSASSFDEAHQSAHEPEKEIDLSKTYREGKLQWKHRPQWKDGKVHELSGESSATYLYRAVHAPAAGGLEVALGSGDGLKVFLNGEEVLDRHVQRAVAPDQEKLTLNLQSGENRLLLKVSNSGGPSGFYFKAPGSGAPEKIAAILRTPLEKRSDPEKAELAVHYRSIAPLLEPTRKRMSELKGKRERLDAMVPKTLVSMSAPPRVVRVLPRGNWLDESGEIVTPGVPAFLGPLEVGDRRLSRLDLARWLASPENPLTARVFVNRLWMLFFGAGLARTPGDLGSQGSWPTHPELLDWLAVEFVESGFDVKRLVRLMVSSSTYRQSSEAGKDLREKDPYNHFFARQSRFRLEAEVVRDNALSISGLLERKIGGASVKPYQPPGHWSHLNFPVRDYQHDHGESQYRRGLYTYWCRTFLHPSLLAFDAPTREECTVSRPRSNTPLQALILLNDPTYLEAARVFAERIVKEGGPGFAERVQWAYSRSLSRTARPGELKVLEDLHRKHLEDYRADRSDAEKLLGVGERPPAKDLDPAELAAWTSVARVILNLHETITRS